MKEQPEVDITTNPNATILHSVRMDFLLYIHKDHNYILDFYIFHLYKPFAYPQSVFTSQAIHLHCLQTSISMILLSPSLISLLRGTPQ